MIFLKNLVHYDRRSLIFACFLEMLGKNLLISRQISRNNCDPCRAGLVDNFYGFIYYRSCMGLFVL